MRKIAACTAGAGSLGNARLHVLCCAACMGAAGWFYRRRLTHLPDMPCRLLPWRPSRLCGAPVARRDALLGSVDPVDSLQGLVATGGRLNVARALAALLNSTTLATSMTCAHLAASMTCAYLAGEAAPRGSLQRLPSVLLHAIAPEGGVPP